MNPCSCLVRKLEILLNRNCGMWCGTPKAQDGQLIPMGSINLALLSLPRNQTINLMRFKMYSTKSGLPIHSLPGWDLLPLDQKLPMLKCPRNEVIFSKDKIGRALKTKQAAEFDSSSTREIPEYNPLHDPHLKYFYSKERNMKRLRQNGEITEENDVICTLKDFNEYRNQLHKFHVQYIVQELQKKEAENHQRRMVEHAEHIKKCEQDQPTTAVEEHKLAGIRKRKKMIEDQRRERFERMLHKSQEKFREIETKKTLQQSMLDYSKQLNLLKLQQHQEVADDLRRKRFIAIKKLLQFKSDRFEKTVAKLREENIDKEDNDKEKAWQRRLNERIEHQKMVRYILDTVSNQRRAKVKQRHERFERQWEKLQCSMQERIKKEHGLKKRKSNREVKKHKKIKLEAPKKDDDVISLCSAHAESLDNLLDDELCDILTATVEMPSDLDAALPIALDDPVWKSAKFIINHIIAKFTKDMSGNRQLFCDVQSRVDNFFTEAKQFVIKRATQVIASARKSAHNGDNVEKVPGEFEFNVRLCMKTVDFKCIPSTIGTSSYQVDPNIELRPVEDRTPTPPGSLASFTIPTEEEKDKKPMLPRDEMLFIEHYLIKFKRELIVGVGRKVFMAIRCHFDKKTMEIRKELLDVDKNFLTKQVTKAILSHAVNPLNFETALYLCISVVSSEITWALQKNLLRSPCGPCSISRPARKCHD